MSKSQKSTDAANPEGVLVRVLVGVKIGQFILDPNQLVILPPALAEAYVKAGAVSDDKAGIAWCTKEFPESHPFSIRVTGDEKPEADSAAKPTDSPD